MNPQQPRSDIDSHTEVDLSTERLAHLVHQKSILVRELHKLVTKQQEMIRHQEVDLIPLLAVKQRVLETLNEIDRAMDPFRQQDPDGRNWKSNETRVACREEADHCEALFRQVLVVENDCTMALQQQQQKTKEQLQGAVAAGQVNRAYQQTQANVTPQRYRLDLVSEG
jgi:hypothetical protein